jgi:exopolyphosphatase/guanosine-5'-triphosphate,3'-diphosphate pyrophosphatase
MKRNRLIGLIDIGFHSVKMYIGEVERKKNIRKIEYLWVPIAVGKDILKQGTLSNPVIQEVIHIIKNFKEVIDSYSVSQYKAIVSSSIKAAGNAEVLIERVLNVTGIKIEIVEPIEETQAVYEGIKLFLKERYGFLDKNFLIFSLGGGSTQIILQSKGKIVFSETHHIGTLRMIKDLDFSQKSFQINLRPFSLSFVQTLKRFPGISKIDGFVGINDDALSLVQKVFSDFLVKDFYRIPREEFNRFFYQIEAMQLDKIKEKFQLNDNLLKTAKAAILMLGMFYDLTSAKTILIPNVSNSFFMLYKTAFTKVNSQDIQPGERENIFSSAIAIGKKYQFDAEHAFEVKELALSIFDGLQEHYHFNEKERVYLETACILHDIGIFVSPTNHHKHSAQLIRSSEILGLQQNEMELIAQIARYHRKSSPKASHDEYSELPIEEKLIVSRLASIIRIADAMDSTHSQIVEGLKLRLSEEECAIVIKIKGNHYEYMELLKGAVKKKADLFESFFGLSVNLEKWV